MVWCEDFMKQNKKKKHHLKQKMRFSWWWYLWWAKLYRWVTHFSLSLWWFEICQTHKTNKPDSSGNGGCRTSMVYLLYIPRYLNGFDWFGDISPRLSNPVSTVIYILLYNLQGVKKFSDTCHQLLFYDCLSLSWGLKSHQKPVEVLRLRGRPQKTGAGLYW